MASPIRGLSAFCVLAIFLGIYSHFYRLWAQSGTSLSASIPELKHRAESGDLSAQSELGEFLMGVDPAADSYDAAMEWLRSAVAQSSSHAEFVLGYLYHHGHGVPQDYAQAAQYYQRAILHGHRIAPNNLAVLYQHGFGVPKNPAKALELFHSS